jgi:Uma2 family endonuclease
MNTVEPVGRIYTYGDLESFPEDQSWELIDGIPYLQAKPSGTHQYISGQIIRHLLNYLDDKPCRAYQDFPIWPEGRPRNKNAKGYLVPDILVNCDPSLYTEDGIIGPPSLVIEILSPSNARDDKIDKLNKYQAFGVQQYWIVSPEYRIVEVYTLADDGFYRMVSCDRIVRFQELEIDLIKIFPPLPVETELDEGV